MKIIFGLILLIGFLWYQGWLEPVFKAFHKIRSRQFKARFPSEPVKALIALSENPNSDRFVHAIEKSDPATLVEYKRQIGAEHTLLFEKAVAHKPDMAILHTLYAHALIYRAWDARGGGAASSVTIDGANAFFNDLKMARDVLTTSLNLDPNIQMTYGLMITTHMGLSNKSAAQTCFNEAKRRFPEYIDYHLDMLKLLAERWLGDQFEDQNFVKKHTRQCESPVLLALIPAQHIDHTIGMRGKECRQYFKDKTIRTDILDAFDTLSRMSVPQDPALADQYFTALNIFAFVAIYMTDKKLGKAAFTLIGDHPSRYPWSYVNNDTLAEFFKARSLFLGPFA